MLRPLLCTLFLLAYDTLAQSQYNTDAAYQRPLKEVLQAIEQRYGISIKYPDSLVNNKTVSYANWRYRNDAETTLARYWRHWI
ncbi:MAG TPA: hypothetical protein VL307_13085 [Chitinophagaceae bacterium]|nr:hypothetical protein [Chitinophagaceae bacterium]